MNAVIDPVARDARERLNAVLGRQRAAYLANPYPDLRQRREDLTALKRMVDDHVEDIVDAIDQDYGNRSRHETLFAEIVTAVGSVEYSLKHLRQWMKTRRRHVDQVLFPGGKARVIPQPLGVVGVIVPWNFPINLSFSQLAAIFAAGNRAMVKMSENSIALSRLLKDISSDYFPEDKLAFFEETGGVGIEFSKLPLDKLIFTGSGETGRSVMAAAARNLTPVVLELGGKSPAIIDHEYPLGKAVERIMFAKQYNAGQICTTVDYVFVHESQRDRFIDRARRAARKLVPDIASDDYTAIIDDRSFRRLLDTLDDARDKGATVINLSRDQQPDQERRKFPLHLVLDTTPDMVIRKRETFGPLLMVLTYREPADVIRHVNAHDRPLAFYPFTNDRELAAHYIERVMSGGVTVNDAMFHVAQHDLPFGGVGESGMGHYHGFEGFRTFSKLRPVYYQPRFSPAKFLAPPYGRLADRVIGFLARRGS